MADRKKPAKRPLADRSKAKPPVARQGSVDAFVEASRDHGGLPARTVTHRLIFALDATASRQPTWDLATELHAALFDEAERLGNVAVQLCYYRGIGEFHASRWAQTPADLRRAMLNVHCQGGRTQVTRLLGHAADEAARHPVKTLIFIGDCFEENEADMLATAGQLKLRGVPVLVFQEGHNRVAQRAFSALARLTDGACVPFDPASPAALRRLLSAAVSFAIGGRSALEDFSQRHKDGESRLLLSKLP